MQSSAALVARSSMKARSTRRSSTTPTMPTAGMPSVKPTARAPSTTSASRDHAPRSRGRRRCRRTRAGRARRCGPCRRRSRSIPSVPDGRRLVVVPVEVVLGEVEHDGGLGGHRVGVVELEAGQLDGEHVVGLGVHHRLDDRQPDVADRGGAQAGGARGSTASICTVVVLPLVPVTASQGAGCSGSRSRHASSTSPQTGTPRSRGLRQERRGRLPARRGDDAGRRRRAARRWRPARAGRSRRASRGAGPSRPSPRWWPRRARSPRRRGRAGCRRRRSRRRRSRRPRRARRTSRWSRPQGPGAMFGGGAQRRRRRTSAVIRCRRPTRRRRCRARWRRARPVMIQKRITMVTCSQPSISKWWCSGVIRNTRWPAWTRKTRPEQPAGAAELEDRDLDHHREGDGHEQPADDHEQQLGAGHDREAGHRAAEREGAGVAHDDLGRRGVPPQEAEAGAGDGGGDDGEVERVAHLVALGAGLERAGLAVLPDVDQRVGREDQDATRPWRGRRGRRRG